MNKFPRFKVPIKLLEGDLASFKDSQTKLDFFIFNEDTGDSVYIDVAITYNLASYLWYQPLVLE